MYFGKVGLMNTLRISRLTLHLSILLLVQWYLVLLRFNITL
jgi:hypothetical protein